MSVIVPVTVCIPCYNPNNRLLYRSLLSVLNQTFLPLEVILVDDGSSEEVKVPNIPRIKSLNVSVIRVTNRGLPNARNVALMNANGEAFLALDDDDWLEPNFIESTLPLLKDADVVCVGLQEHGVRHGTFMPGFDRPLDQVTAELMEKNNHLFYCCLYSTALLKSVGGWNGRMINGWEDWDMWWDLFRRPNVRFAAVNEVLFHYDVRKNGMAYNTDLHWRDSNLIEMRRHHGLRP